MVKRDTEKQRILQLLRSGRGALRRRDIRLGRTGQRALADLLNAGDAQRTAGVIHLPDAPRAIVVCRSFGGVLTAESALEYYGLPVMRRPREFHIAVPANTGVIRALGGVIVHREAHLGRIDPLAMPVASPELILARMLRRSPEIDAVAALDAALREGLVSFEEIRALLEGDGHQAPTARARLERANPRSRSLIESRLRVELEDAGHQVDVGVVVDGVGEVDLLVDRRLFVETDGFAYHSSREALAKDRDRDQRMMSRGLPVVRLTYEDVMRGCGVIIVEAALRGLDAGPVPVVVDLDPLTGAPRLAW